MSEKENAVRRGRQLEKEKEKRKKKEGERERGSLNYGKEWYLQIDIASRERARTDYSACKGKGKVEKKKQCISCHTSRKQRDINSKRGAYGIMRYG